MHHIYHAPYVDIQLSPDVLEFIRARIPTSTPSEIYRDLLAANISESMSAAQYQVYYQWQHANSQV
jgi:hypothetical protein